MTGTSSLLRYLTVLAGPAPERRLLEIRARRDGGGMTQRFIPATRLDHAAPLIALQCILTDVYTGVLLRDRFHCPPTLVIASGIPGHLHAYWRLTTDIGVAELEQANRRLAYRLGGDQACVDAARILRPLSVGPRSGADVSPARSFADASATDRGGRR